MPGRTKIEIPVNCIDPLHDNSQECYNFVFSIQQNFVGLSFKIFLDQMR